jgi:segregation and condensation protein A
VPDRTSPQYRVELPAFEGPLGLLLHLIRQNEIDIYDIPVAQITKQYEEHLTLMQELDLEVAGEYFVMAATLIRIKARTLLPPPPGEEGEDPRKELVDQLLDHQRFQEAAAELRKREEAASAVHARPPGVSDDLVEEEVLLELDLYQLVAAFQGILRRRELQRPIAVRPPRFTVEEKVEEIREMLSGTGTVLFADLFREAGDREEVVTSFLALLELVKGGEVQCVQGEPGGEIRVHVRAAPQESPWGGETP